MFRARGEVLPTIARLGGGGKGKLGEGGRRGGYLIEGVEEGVVFVARGEKQGG